MNHIRSIVMTVLLSVACLGAQAADSGFYIGGGIGQFSVKDNSERGMDGRTIDFDADDTSYKAFIGYRMTWLPLIDLAVEGGYTDFGRPSKTVRGQKVEYELTGTSLAGLVILPLGPIDMFGKVGALHWNSTLDTGNSSADDSGTNAVYGLGLGIKIWRIGVRAEYEYIDVQDVDATQMYSVSAVFQF